MPVSNPSYFPVSRSNGSVVGITANNLTTGARVFLGGQGAGGSTNAALDDIVVLGDHALSGAVSDLDAIGSVIVGSQAVKLATALAGPVTVMGFNALASATNNGVGQSVYIGDSAGANLQARQSIQNVVIGSQAMKNFPGSPAFLGGSDRNVAIGFQAANGVGQFAGLTFNVVIGALAMSTYSGGSGPSVGITQNVVIGDSAGLRMGESAGSNVSSNVFIGYACGGTFVAGDGNVMVGQGVGPSITNSLNNATAIGTAVTVDGDNSVVIGRSAVATQLGIAIGARAGVGTSPALSTGGFVMEADDGSGVHYAMFYGDMITGNLVVGHSSNGVDRDTGGAATRNCLKLLNGVVGVNAPVGGGYFSVSSTALENSALLWVNSAGAAIPLSGGRSYTVATLPNAANAGIGAMVMVNDATLTAITGLGLAPTGGGANKVPVYSDGAQWLML